MCSICGEPFGSNDLAVDHIDPVVPIDTASKDMSWDTIIWRMFNSPKENLQAVCKSCHKVKTDEENNDRRKVRGNVL